MYRAILSKASPVREYETVPDAAIEFSESMQKNMPFDRLEELYRGQAHGIRDVFFNHVSQAIRHQLLILLLQDAKNNYIGAK